MAEENRKRGFLIMPFDRTFDSLRDDIIAASIDEGVYTQRGDDVFAPGVILDQILKDIDEADVVFAVCTRRNANVFFELGYAWRHHKPIIIAESATDLSFNIQHARTIIYGGTTSLDGPETLVPRLRKAVRAALGTDNLPQGQILKSTPQPKQAARLNGSIQDLGKSRRLVVTNTGTVDVHQVDVEVPEEATSFRLVAYDLPVDILRPGESIKIPASVTMGGGKSIFDIKMHGIVGDDEPVEFYYKVSL